MIDEQIEEMAKHGCYDGCASGLRKFCEEYDGKPCKNMVRIARGLYEQCYRKIDDNCEVITKDDLEIYKKQAIKEFAEKLKERLNLGLYEWQYAKVNSKIIDELLKEYEK